MENQIVYVVLSKICKGCVIGVFGNFNSLKDYFQQYIMDSEFIHYNSILTLEELDYYLFENLNNLFIIRQKQVK